VLTQRLDAFARRNAANIIILVAWCALTAVMLANHEPWRDEGQAWLIVRDSPDLASIVSLLGYEGSPGLWHLLLYPLAHGGAPYWTMAALHSLLALCAVALLLFRSPLWTIEKAFIVLGYTLLYRYNVVARSYVLSCILLFMVAATYGSRRDRPWLHGLLLALLANTNLHAAIIAVGLAGAYAWETLLGPGRNLAAAGAALGIFGLGLGLAVYQVLPPPDLMRSLVRWRGLSLAADRTEEVRALTTALHGYFPAPEALTLVPTALSRFVWGWSHLAGLAELALGLVVLSRVPRVLWAYVGSAAALLVLFVFKYTGGPWHHGMLLVSLIACAWIVLDEVPDPPGQPAGLSLRRARNAGHFTTRRLVPLVFVGCAIAGPMVFIKETTREYSTGPRVAKWLEAGGWVADRSLVAVYPAPMGAAILPLLHDRDFRFYYPEYDAFGSYAIWNAAIDPSNELTRHEVAERVLERAESGSYDRVLLLCHHRTADPPVELSDGRYRLIRIFDGSVVDEWYDAYELVSRAPVLTVPDEDVGPTWTAPYGR
jgi:hypothetical protein